MQCTCAVFLSVACPSPPYFSTLSHKRQDFRLEVIERTSKVFVLVLSRICTRNISHSKMNWADVTINVHRSTCKVPVIIIVKFYWNLKILYRFSKKFSSNKFHENSSNGRRAVPGGRRNGQTGGWTDRQTDRETDRQTDMKKLIVAFRNLQTRLLSGFRFPGASFVKDISQFYQPVPTTLPGVDSASKNEYQDIPGGKDGRCVRVTTLPPSCAECLEILEP